MHPQVEFEIRLPLTTWNGKFFETGCAAMCGVTYIDSLCPSLLRKGYACIASDMGHHGKITNGVWAYNNLEAEVDFGYRAAHVTALAGKAITQYFYGRAPEKSYFCGCSTGGREGLVEAQRFPWDFDGIIAGAPASDQSGTIMVRLWAALAMRGHDGHPVLSGDDLQFVHKAVVEACDLNDGVKDGLIGDPRVFTFDPATLACNASSHGRCLAREQIDALLKNVHRPCAIRWAADLPDGRLMRGSELAFADFFGGGRFSAFDTDFMRYMDFFRSGADLQVDDLNFDRDYKRFGMMESLYAATNPDLRRFKAHGKADRLPGMGRRRIWRHTSAQGCRLLRNDREDDGWPSSDERLL